LSYYVYADDPPARREAEAVRCFIKATTQKEVITALVNASDLTTMKEALDLAIRTRDRHMAFLPKPKLLVRQLVSQDLADDGPESGPLDELEPEQLAELVEEYQLKLRGYQDRPGQGYQPRPRQSNYQSRDKQELVCWQCRQPGHMSRDCPLSLRYLPEWLRKEMDELRRRLESAEGSTSPPAQTNQRPGSDRPSDHGPPPRQQDTQAYPRQAYQPAKETARDIQMQIRVLCESAPPPTGSQAPRATPQLVTVDTKPDNTDAAAPQATSGPSHKTGPNHARNLKWKAHRKQNLAARKAKAEGEVSVTVQAPIRETPNTDQRPTQGNGQ
jgi:hypothetical protein